MMERSFGDVVDEMEQIRELEEWSKTKVIQECVLLRRALKLSVNLATSYDLAPFERGQIQAIRERFDIPYEQA